MNIYWLGAALIAAAAILIGLNLTFSLKIKWHSNRLRDCADNSTAASFLKGIPSIWWIPNKPEFWTALKESYFIIYHNPSIDFDIKLDLYQLLTKKRVYGLRKPIRRKSIQLPS
ncbi:hypothetical protein LRR81_10430 [Metabacillus sp. GX 13764]|uniref:hypothetical protein n=1 Tax=Metabacillus kandeliae TaxID=2900151 RepID=UPI001E42C2F6|nr:hypothetical protein [Metabacillus kandeliae]MCD7034658.1 hypothetical protein [Metabacillus kandeliae]